MMYTSKPSKIEKVPRNIQGETQEKTQVRENWSQELEHKQVPKQEGN